MTAAPKKSASKKRSAKAAPRTAAGKKSGGGAAAGGGINFQAAVTAIAGAHLLRGGAIGWLPVDDVPTAVWSESEGPGDDLRLELASGRSAEVQAKKGLNRSAGLDALEPLVRGVQAGDPDYAVLAVAPDSIRTVREDLGTDLARLGQGRSDHLTDIGKELHMRLKAIGGDWQDACTRIRVQVVHALAGDGADIRTAKEVLASICADAADAGGAWQALYKDAALAIEQRGRWTVPHLLQVLDRGRAASRGDGRRRPHPRAGAPR